VRSPSSGMDAIDGHEVLRGRSVKVVPVLVRYRVSSSTALVMHIFIGSCPYSPWAAWMYGCHRCYVSCVTEALLQ
jgi:hypothetical protein